MYLVDLSSFQAVECSLKADGVSKCIRMKTSSVQGDPACCTIIVSELLVLRLLLAVAG